VLEDRVVVAGINMVKKHVKANPARGAQGGIVDQEASLHISNVAVFNAATQKADRLGYKLLDDGKKVRVFKSSGEVVDVK
jgi:large subunit ribosomal protein L24